VLEISDLDDIKFYLHMNRNKPRYNIAPEEKNKWKLLDFDTNMRRARLMTEELRLSSPNTIELVFNPKLEKISYERLTRSWDTRFHAYSRSFSLLSAENLRSLNPDWNYMSNEENSIYKFSFSYSEKRLVESKEFSIDFKEIPLLIKRNIDITAPEVFIFKTILRALIDLELDYQLSQNNTPYFNFVLGKLSIHEADLESRSGYSLQFSTASEMNRAAHLGAVYSGIHESKSWYNIKLSKKFLPFTSKYVLDKYCKILVLEKLKDLGCCNYNFITNVIRGRSPIIALDRGISEAINYLAAELSTEISNTLVLPNETNLISQIIDMIENDRLDTNLYLLTNPRFPHYFSSKPIGETVDIKFLKDNLAQGKITDISMISHSERRVRYPTIDREEDIAITGIATDLDNLMDLLATLEEINEDSEEEEFDLEHKIDDEE
jgi:hypothetical protein